MKMENNLEDIYYSKEYQVESKIHSERFLFIQWIVDLICVTEALIDKYDRWYLQIFYIKLAGLFEILKKDSSISLSEDKYIQKNKKHFNSIYNSLTNDECIYIIYRRDCVAHPIQNAYDIYHASGDKIVKQRDCNIKGEKVTLSREDIDRAIGNILESHGNIDKNCDIDIVKKVFPFISQMKEGLYEKYIESLAFFE